MGSHIVLARLQHAEGNHPQREQRQKVDGAPRPPGSDRVNEERSPRDQNHENGPSPTDRSMRQRSLGGQELDSAKANRREGESRVKTYDWRGVEQRGERHIPILGVSVDCC
jgi:hypothetical protein